MKKSVPIFLIVLSFFSSCSKEDKTNGNITNKVLTLKVDYLTNTFEGGKETSYPVNSSTFTITSQYIFPGDFGNLKLKYQELNEIIFDGDIIWMGRGNIKYPQNMLPANQFDSVATTNIVMPTAGFQNVFNPNNHAFEYTPIWFAVQKLVKVRDYLNANPNTAVKLFLYTPSVGAGIPADWDWIIFMKN